MYKTVFQSEPSQSLIFMTLQMCTELYNHKLQGCMQESMQFKGTVAIKNKI